MNKQSEIIKILSQELAERTDCFADMEPPPLWCTGERCDQLVGNEAKCWVRWAAEQIKGE